MVDGLTKVNQKEHREDPRVAVSINSPGGPLFLVMQRCGISGREEIVLPGVGYSKSKYRQVDL